MEPKAPREPQAASRHNGESCVGGRGNSSTVCSARAASDQGFDGLKQILHCKRKPPEPRPDLPRTLATLALEQRAVMPFNGSRVRGGPRASIWHAFGHQAGHVTSFGRAAVNGQHGQHGQHKHGQRIAEQPLGRDGGRQRCGSHLRSPHPAATRPSSFSTMVRKDCPRLAPAPCCALTHAVASKSAPAPRDLLSTARLFGWLPLAPLLHKDSDNWA